MLLVTPDCGTSLVTVTAGTPAVTAEERVRVDCWLGIRVCVSVASVGSVTTLLSRISLTPATVGHTVSSVAAMFSADVDFSTRPARVSVADLVPTRGTLPLDVPVVRPRSARVSAYDRPSIVAAPVNLAKSLATGVPDTDRAPIATTVASTYAFVLCCVGTFVARSEPILSSSITHVLADTSESEFIVAPAAFTLVASVTSAEASIPASLDSSAVV